MAATTHAPTIPLGMSLVDEYLRLILGTKRLLEDGINSLAQKGKSGSEHLRQALELTTERLSSDQAKSAIAYASSKLEPSTIDTLGSELRFVNANLPDDGSSIFDDDARADAAEDAKTGKDSLEEFLKKWLPKWLKQALRVLNELLSIVFKA